MKLKRLFKFKLKKRRPRKDCIYNYKMKEFLKKDFELITEYVTLLSNVKPAETEQAVFHMSLSEVEYIKRNISSNSDNDLIEVVCLVQKIKQKELFNMKIIDFFGIVNSIKKQILRIQEAEEKALVPESTNIKWEIVQGSAIMSKFGIYNTLRKLVFTYGQTVEYWRNEKYSEIFTLLKMDVTEADLQQKMKEIKLNTN